MLGRYSGYFDGFDNDEILDIISLPEPETCSSEKRWHLMEREEFVKFDAAHFVADYFEDNSIRDIAQGQAWWEEAPSESTPEVGTIWAAIILFRLANHHR